MKKHKRDLEHRSYVKGYQQFKVVLYPFVPIKKTQQWPTSGVGVGVKVERMAGLAITPPPANIKRAT